MRLRQQFGAVALAALFAAAAARAHTETGVLSGLVTDATGAAMPRVSVTVKSPETRQAWSGATDPEGKYSVAGLPAAVYDVEFSKDGFRTVVERGVRVETDRIAKVDVKLEIGAASAAVEVAARNHDLNTDDDIIESVLGAVELAEMVQNDRSITDLGYFGPGVARRAAGALGSGFVIGGARADSTNFLVDGLNDHDPRTGGIEVMPNYDAIDEFRIQATGEAAEYGRMAGGVMTARLRSGGNRVHGSLFDNERTSALGARNFFDVHKSEILRHQGGAMLSGPVTLPRVYSGKNRTFFLLSWEGLFQSQGDSRLSNVPLGAERSGDFSKTFNASGQAAAITDPLTGKPFPGNLIPASRQSSIAQGLAGYYPLPNRADPSTNYETYQVTHARYNSAVAKLDEHVRASDTISARYLVRDNSGTSPYAGSDLGTFGTNTSSRPVLAGISETHVFSPSMVNEARVGFTRYAERDRASDAGLDINAGLGLPGPNNPVQAGFPRFTILNLAAVGDAANQPLTITTNTWEAAEALSRSRGRHTLKFGADVLRTQFFQQLYNNERGTFNFLGRWTGSPFADFLLGLPDSTSRQASAVTAYLFSTDVGVFAQDEFMVSSRLTLSYGVRYEIMRPPYEKFGRMSSFAPGMDKLIVADGSAVANLAAMVASAGLTGRVATAADAGLPRSLVYGNHLDLAPRFGFAWRPFRKESTAIRGGYGIYFANSLLDPVRNDLTNIYPFTVSQTFNRVSSQPNALTLGNPFPASLATLPGVTNANGFEARPGAQYVQSYTVTIDQQIGADTTLEIDYIGSRGTHLGQRFDLNQPFRGPAGSLRPYTGFGAINFYSFGGNSVYNGGMLTVRRRYRRGLYFGATYVFSKSIDDASQVSGSSQGDYPGAQNSRNLEAERGRSDWDTGHSVTGFAGWTLPFRGRLLGNWVISTDVRAYTGQPFTPRVSSANLTLGEAGRPDRAGSGKLAAPGAARWFDVSAFPVVTASAYRFGTSGRNILDGPGSVYWNTALSRNLKLADRVTGQVRCEAVNFLNHANFGLPVNYVDAKNAGQILSADGARIVQFGVRVRF
jgi:hypothetical protein